MEARIGLEAPSLRRGALPQLGVDQVLLTPLLLLLLLLLFLLLLLLLLLLVCIDFLKPCGVHRCLLARVLVAIRGKVDVVSSPFGLEAPPCRSRTFPQLLINQTRVDGGFGRLLLLVVFDRHQSLPRRGSARFRRRLNLRITPLVRQPVMLPYAQVMRLLLAIVVQHLGNRHSADIEDLDYLAREPCVLARPV